MDSEIRWEQRFSNFEKALNKLSQAVEYIKHNLIDENEPIDDSDTRHVLDEIIKEGIIQRFEYTHELAWKVMKDYATYQGNPNVGGSRDATREAFQLKLVSDSFLLLIIFIGINKVGYQGLLY
ncbi:HI0074 family nucleotidyltransferase substrate-binding subunit [uncultured Cyclobacterium sp.]|uniref:HI0074 family nucleotidyltransferase substrate-binding subunit n=1 Tax=uncultured Cyclobacterium sp. TaxID=453820 RepID=UPI0030EF094B